MLGRKLLVLALWLTGPALALWSQSPSLAEPRYGAEILLPGRLPWGASALPTGEILAACEDQSLLVLNDQAKVLTLWRAPSRFSAPITVGPRSSFQLLAAPLVSGRVEVLVWDSRTSTLGRAYSAIRGGEALATAWGPSGTLYVSWKDGTVEAWTPQGIRLWSAPLPGAISWLIVDEGLGVYAFGAGQATLFDVQGRPAGQWAFSGLPKGVLQTMGGELLCWTETGLWRQDLSAGRFVSLLESSQILGVVADRQDRLVVTETDRILRLGTSGNGLSSTALPRQAITPASLDDRGRILFGTLAGLEVWSYAGRLLGILEAAPPASSLLLTDQGLGIWSSADWRVRVWTGFQKPRYSWSQEGGGAGRPYSARRPASVAVRSFNWTQDPDFGYLFELASSPEEGKQRQALERLESIPPGRLLEVYPFANLVLLKIGRSGLTDVALAGNMVTNNWPGLRFRAFTLLAQTAGPEDRDEMIDVLKREFDASVAAQGARALGRSGWDGDGKLIRLLVDLQGRMKDQAGVADAIIEAASDLWRVNGLSSDPGLVPLVSAIFQGPYPRSVKLKAQKMFQDLMEAP